MKNSNMPLFNKTISENKLLIPKGLHTSILKYLRITMILNVFIKKSVYMTENLCDVCTYILSKNFILRRVYNMFNFSFLVIVSYIYEHDAHLGIKKKNTVTSSFRSTLYIRIPIHRIPYLRTYKSSVTSLLGICFLKALNKALSHLF